MPRPAIVTRDLTKRYGQVTVVYHLTMDVPKGRVSGLLGPNGAGKSTTIKMMTGRIRPTFGNVEVDGLDPWKQRHKVMETLGYLPERPTHYPDMTAIRFLTYMGRLAGMSRSVAKRRAREVLHLVGLGRIEARRIGQMSAGQKQRLGFANTILHEPEILILDEPTANLDPAGRIYVMRLIEQLAEEGKTIVISSHILPEIERICNWVAIISEGNLLVSGNMGDLIKNKFDNHYVLQTSDQEQFLQLVQELSYVKEAYLEEGLIYLHVDFDHLLELWDSIPRLATESKIHLQSFRPLRDPLETVFIDVIGQKGREEV